MLRILSHVAKEDCFALKGGTAINLFVRDMPRLSIDIDLTYLPIEDRQESLKNISEALQRIADGIRKVIYCKVQSTKNSEAGLEYAHKLIITAKEGIVKIEPNIVFRGRVFPPEKRTLVKTAQEKFELSTAITTLSMADLYGGKLCAALDRQHPRDLFDVKMLLESGGIDSEIRKAFVIYLAGHKRPIHELLNPNFKDIQTEYENDFLGMTETEIPYKDLIQCQKTLPPLIRGKLLESEKKFLISLKEGDPNWNLLGVNEIEKLPALQWKLKNIQAFQKKDKIKWNEQLKKLKSVLE